MLSYSERRMVQSSKIVTSRPWPGRSRTSGAIRRKVTSRMSGLAIGLLESCRQAKRKLSDAIHVMKGWGANRKSALGKANEDLETAQGELHRRWHYLAE